MNCSCSKQIFFEILCLHVPVYRRSGDKGIKHFPDRSGGSRGRAQGTHPPPPLFLDHNEAPRAEKKFLETPPSPSPLSGGLDLPLDSSCNI